MKRHVQEHMALLLALALPLALLAVDPNWPFTNPFQPPWFDPFVYQGLFVHPQEYIAPHQTYYPATRVPWLAFGAVFYALLPTVAANVALKLSVFFVTVLAFYAAAAQAAGRFAAGVSAMLLGTYAYFVMSVGWDYVDGMVVMLLAVGYACAALAARRSSGPPTGEVLVGATYAALISCNPFSLVLGPSVLIFYLAVMARAGRLNWTGWLARIAGAVSGFLAGAVVLAFVSKLLGGDPLYLLVQVRAAFELSAPSSAAVSWSIRFEPWKHLLPVSTWLAVPVSVVVISAVLGVFAGVRLIRRRNADDLFMLLVAVHYLVAFGLFALSTAVSLAVLLFWFYTSYLDISAFLTLACALGYLRRWNGGVRSVWPWAVAAAVMLASFAPPIGLFVQHELGFSVGAVKGATSLAWVLPGLGLLLLACLRRLYLLALPGALVLGVGNISMMTQAQLSPDYTENRVSGFLAMEDMAEAIRTDSGNPRRFVWVDRTEKPYGGLFHAAWIESLLSAKNPVGNEASTKFPDLPPFGLRPGDLVVIATNRPDWREAADSKLSTINLVLDPGKVETIQRGDIHFTLVLGQVVPKT